MKRCPNPCHEDSEIEIRQIYEAQEFGEMLTPEMREREDRMREQLEGKKA